MNSLICKLATINDDYEKCLAIRRKVFIEEQGVPEEIEIDEYENSSKHFLVTMNEKPVATGRVRLKGSLIKFERIASLETVRGSGTGKVLMSFMHEFVKKNYPLHLPAMHAQKSAYGFYEKLGWKAVGEEFVEADIVHQMMIYPPGNRDSIDKLLLLDDPTITNDIKMYLTTSM